MLPLEFINALPKAELHLHFEGTVPWEMVRACSSGNLPETPPWWADDFRFDDFTHFAQTLGMCYRPVLTSLDRYYEVAHKAFAQLASQNVRYVETSFSAEHAASLGLALADIVAVIKRAAPPNMVVCVYCGLLRTILRTLEDPLVQAIFATPNLDGLDLHGDESLQEAAPFADIFIAAKKQGLGVKAHAGELVGPASIYQALDLLQVTRIEHGTTAKEDNGLLQRLAQERIILDMSPWSNVKLNVVEGITVHPITEFYKQGILVTINTDDPVLFGYTLTDELQSLVTNLKFSLPDLAQLQRNAFKVAKISATQRASILKEIDKVVAKAGN